MSATGNSDEGAGRQLSEADRARIEQLREEIRERLDEIGRIVAAAFEGGEDPAD